MDNALRAWNTGTMQRSWLVAVIVVCLFGCRNSREDRVKEALAEKGFSQIHLKKNNTFTYEFTAIKQGIECEGTAKVAELTRSYAARDRVKTTWYCGQ